MNSTPSPSDYLRNGINLVRLQVDGSKLPVGEWKQYQTRMVTEAEIGDWFEQCGMGALCGSISSNLFVIDVDRNGKEVWNRLQQDIPEILSRLVVVSTPRPGFQLWMRLQDTPPGSGKLAYSDELNEKGKPLIMIETRGTGGYVACPGSRVDVHKNGKPYKFHVGNLETIPVLDRPTFDRLMDTCRSYTKHPLEEKQESNGQVYEGCPRPGDVFNRIGDIRQMLLDADWEFESEDDDGVIYLRRPGSEHLRSASLGYAKAADGRPLLKVFSTNTEFDTEKTYDAFGVYAVLNHDGDLGEASAAINEKYAAQVGAAQQEYNNRQQTGTQQTDNSGDGLVITLDTAIREERVMWLWPGRFALGKLTLLTGDGGVGKSILTCDLAARLSTGRPFPDGNQGMFGETLFITGEDGLADTIKPRLMAAGHQEGWCKFLDGPRVGNSPYPEPFDLSRHIGLLDQAIKASPRAKLLVIDPIMDYMGASCDTYKPGDVRRVLSPLRILAEAHNIAVILINHLNRAVGRSSKSRSLGSGAFNHVCRVEMRVAEDPQNSQRRLLLPVKNNLADPTGLAYQIKGNPNGAGYAVWEPDPVDVTIDEVEQQSPSGNYGPRKADLAEQWLLGRLAKGPVAVKRLEAEAEIVPDFSWRTVERAKLRRNIESVTIDGTNHWQLPTQ